MNSRCSATLLAVLLGCSTLAAADAPTSPTADVQDILYFSPSGPVRLRFHLQTADKQLSARWNEFVDGLMIYFDRDGDGKLDAKELGAFAKFPLVDGSSEFDVELGSVARRRTVLDMAATYADKDGKISRAELAAFFRKHELGPVHVAIVPTSSLVKELNEALFKRLDTDMDGKISRAELERAVEVLKKVDLNEDEIITQDELLDRAPRNDQPALVDPLGDPSEPAQGSPDFFAIDSDDLAASVRQIIAARGKNKAQSLSKADSSMDDKLFAAVDKNGDGKLDLAELTAWLKLPPDVEYTVAFQGAVGTTKVGAPDGRETPLATSVKAGADGVLRLVLPRAIVSVPTTAPSDPGGSEDAALLQAYRDLVYYKKVVGKKELEGVPKLALLALGFDAADRNGDGKIDVMEVTAFTKLRQKSAGCQIMLTVADQSRGLFELIDLNHDGRLSPRELQNAPRIMSSWGRGNGTLSHDALPQHVTINPLLRSLVASENETRLPIRSGRRPVDAPKIAKKGPAWFHKMDRNGDGDISRKEWLGPLELFKRLDKDGDGLISVQEAIEAESELPTVKDK